MRLMSVGLVSIALVAAGFAHPAAAQDTVAVPSFVEETAGAGIDSVNAREWEYMAGGGVATIDIKHEGFPDIMLAGGDRPPSSIATPARRRRLHFETQKATSSWMGDGRHPLTSMATASLSVLLRVGENVVMRGIGNCRFVRANESWGFDGGDAWSTAFAATWERGADWPTLAVGNYIDLRQDMSPWGSCTDNWLHRPQVVDGKTQRQFAAPLALKPSFCALSMLFTDWNRSGTPSLRVSNDREYYEAARSSSGISIRARPHPIPRAKVEILAHLGHGHRRLRPRFRRLPGILPHQHGRQQAADARQRPAGPPRIQGRGLCQGRHGASPLHGRRLEAQHGVAYAVRRRQQRWPGGFVHRQGQCGEDADFAAKDPNNLLLQGADGKFREAGDKAGVASFAISRGAALADFNLDGLLDLVVVNRWENAQVWRNTSRNAGRWIEIRLKQPGVNRDAIGAWLEVKRGSAVMRREMTSGGGHAGGQLGWIHFGLGNSEGAEIRVKWPDGEWSPTYPVSANRFVIVDRAKPTADYWYPE
jgi:hypothetical protein